MSKPESTPDIKLLENFSVPIPKGQSKIEALYEGIKGLGYPMYVENCDSYLSGGWDYLSRSKANVGGTNTTDQNLYPSFEAFKEAHEKLNGIAPKQVDTLTKDFPDLEGFLNKYLGGDFQEFMEELYIGSYNGATKFNLWIRYDLVVKCTKTDHDPQGNNYTFVGVIKDKLTEEEWIFEIVDGNGKGTEVINFEKIVDKDKTTEDNTLTRESNPSIDGNLIIKGTLNLNKTEEKTMRRVVTVKLIDPNPAIEASTSLVGDFGEYITDDSNDILIQEIIMEGEVQEMLDNHNSYLTETVDPSILKATGQRVMMQPVRLKDLKWVIKE